MVIRSVASLLCAVLASAAADAQSSAQGSSGKQSSTAASSPPPVVVKGLKSATSTYKISAGDQLEVYVWGDERLQRFVTVLPDGTFGFPLAGTVMGSGHTTNEVEAELSRLLAPQYKGEAPQVTVSIKQSSGLQISVIGKVKGPGTFSPTRYVTVLDALALAGGPTEFADLSNIVILRNVNGKVEVVRARLGGVLKGKPAEGDLASNAIPQLIAGDTVVVP